MPIKIIQIDQVTQINLNSEVVQSDSSQIAILEKQLQGLGVLVIRDTLGANEVAQHLYESYESFFSLTHIEKAEYKAQVSGLSGYHSMNSEKAINSDVYDNKEFWHMIRELSISSSLQYPKNTWPKHFPEMKRLSEDLFQILDTYSHRIIKLLEYYLQVPTGTINNMCIDGPSILRILHYPKCKDTNTTRAHEHTGIQLLGIQPRASHSGIEFYSEKHQWFKFSPDFNNSLFINIGETLEYITKKKLVATKHRVSIKDKESAFVDRYATVFFHHVHPHTIIKNILCDSDNETPHILAHQWWKNRINKISKEKNFK